MAEEKDNQSKIASMLAFAALLSDSRRAPVCPYCGAWGNPIQIAYDDDPAERSSRSIADVWIDHWKHHALAVAGSSPAGLLVADMPWLLAEQQIIHEADNAFSCRHDLRRQYQCCLCTQLFVV